MTSWLVRSETMELPNCAARRMRAPKSSRHRSSPNRECRYALAGSAETQAIRGYRQWVVTSRRGTIRLVRVHGMDCAGRTNPQCHMEYRLGRPRCRVGFDSLDSSRRVGDRERQTLLLFLSTTRSDGSVLWQRRVNRPQSQCLFIGLLALVGR